MNIRLLSYLLELRSREAILRESLLGNLGLLYKKFGFHLIVPLVQKILNIYHSRYTRLPQHT